MLETLALHLQRRTFCGGDESCKTCPWLRRKSDWTALLATINNEAMFQLQRPLFRHAKVNTKIHQVFATHFGCDRRIFVRERMFSLVVRQAVFMESNA